LSVREAVRPRRVVFVGNRPGVFEALVEERDLSVVLAYAPRESALAARAAALSVPVRPFDRADRDRLTDEIAQLDHDILVSNGFPYILPISRMKSGGLHLNVHPGLLPAMRGQHAANGALLFAHAEAGVTMHHMVDACDAGNVIHQERFPITPDLDLGLVYRLLFDLEPVAFRAGLAKLRAAGFDFPGEPQRGPAGSYSRRAEDQQIDPQSMSDEEICRRVRAFGVRSQGVRCTVDDRDYRVFRAEPLTNPHVIGRFATRAPGNLLLEYERALLIRTRDGVVRFSEWEPVT
jgi:methionyl-tRNA formyltransferase